MGATYFMSLTFAAFGATPTHESRPIDGVKKVVCGQQQAFLLGCILRWLHQEIVVQKPYENIIRECSQSWRKKDH